MAEEEAAQVEEGAAPKKSKTMLIVIIVVAVNVAIAAVVLVLVLGSSGEEAAAGAAPATPAPPVPGAQVGPGTLVTLDTFIVNIQGEEGSQYLKTGVVFELVPGAEASTIEPWKTVIRNEVLMYLSSLETRQTRTVKQKQGLQNHIKKITNKKLKADLVANVYFTEFVTQ